MKIITIVFVCFSFLSVAIADSCGGGKVMSLSEGFYGTDTYAIFLDYSNEPSQHPGTEFNGAIAFRPTALSERRLNGIKTLALEALKSNRVVTTWSHNDDCGNATALNLFP